MNITYLYMNITYLYINITYLYINITYLYISPADAYHTHVISHTCDITQIWYHTHVILHTCDITQMWYHICVISHTCDITHIWYHTHVIYEYLHLYWWIYANMGIWGKHRSLLQNIISFVGPFCKRDLWFEIYGYLNFIGEYMQIWCMCISVLGIQI